MKPWHEPHPGTPAVLTAAWRCGHSYHSGLADNMTIGPGRHVVGEHDKTMIAITTGRQPATISWTPRLRRPPWPLVLAAAAQ
jgi:hypothetical protein